MCFVCCQVVKWHFAARVFFYCFIPFLFFEIVKGVESRYYRILDISTILDDEEEQERK